MIDPAVIGLLVAVAVLAGFVDCGGDNLPGPRGPFGAGFGVRLAAGRGARLIRPVMVVVTTGMALRMMWAWLWTRHIAAMRHRYGLRRHARTRSGPMVEIDPIKFVLSVLLPRKRKR